MSFGDSIEAIDAAVDESQRTGHELGGFTRRTGSFGYRFVARCRRCGDEIVVLREAGGWGYAPLEAACSTGGRS